MSGEGVQWCFTINNYSDVDLVTVKSFADSDCRYMVYGLEVGASGTPHIQGYMQLKKKKRLSWLKKNFHSTAHLEQAKGSMAENKAYCSKEGQVTEIGEAVVERQRTDLMTVAKMVGEKRSYLEIAEACPVQCMMYGSGIKDLVSISIPVRDFKTEVFWYWGPTGTGKSKLANEQAVGGYWKNPTNKWWDGYFGQSDVIIDDYRRDFCTFADLLRLLDRYPVQVEYKGGSINFCSKRVFITSPKSPEDTWEGRTDEELEQLLRRIDHVVHFDKL